MRRFANLLRLVGSIGALCGVAWAAQPVFTEVFAAAGSATPLPFTIDGALPWIRETVEPRGVQLFAISAVTDLIGSTIVGRINRRIRKFGK